MARIALAFLLALGVHGATFSAALPQRASIPDTLPTFRDISVAAGLDFTHTSGASDQKFLPEILGSGGQFLDFDADGWIDIFLVDGGSFADPAVARRARHRLFRNRGNGTFADVTEGSGIVHRGYGMGTCAGDYDNDGRIDLYITGVGGNALYRNLGGGRFTAVPNAGGADAAPQQQGLWSTSCAFLDSDRDGHLDLFVTNYVDGWRRNEFCGTTGPPPIRDYCHPILYKPSPSVLYRNTGPSAPLPSTPLRASRAGRIFEDVSTAGAVGAVRGNGLGVAVSDIDADGWPDVFVANDATPNFLFHSTGGGVFREIATLAGVAVSADGRARAGMGTAFADFSGNGRPGLIVTNHETEMHSLFVNDGGRLFSDATVRSGIGPVTRSYVGFGVVAVDYDNDTRLEMAIANGNVMASAAQLRAGAKYGQQNLLLRNTGGRFQDVTDAAGPGFLPELVSRGLAAGDIDNDGDIDLLVTNNNDRPNLLLNEGNHGNAIVVRLVGTTGNRSAIGARLTLVAAGQRLVREVQSGSSYLSQNDLRAHFGLGPATGAARLDIRWPGGATETVQSLPANHVVTIREGQGVVSQVPFRR